jgi:hypothetical protein
MSPHFCKVGKIKPNVKKIISLGEIERIIMNFVEDTSKIDYPERVGTNF